MSSVSKTDAVGHWCDELLPSSAPSGAGAPYTDPLLFPPAFFPMLNPVERRKSAHPPLNELSINRLCQILVLTS